MQVSRRLGILLLGRCVVVAGISASCERAQQGAHRADSEHACSHAMLNSQNESSPLNGPVGCLRGRIADMKYTCSRAHQCTTRAAVHISAPHRPCEPGHIARPNMMDTGPGVCWRWRGDGAALPKSREGSGRALEHPGRSSVWPRRDLPPPNLYAGFPTRRHGMPSPGCA